MKSAVIIVFIALCISAASGDAQVTAKQTVRCAILVPPEPSSAGIHALKITVGYGSSAHRISGASQLPEVGVPRRQGEAGRIGGPVGPAGSRFVTVTD
jgi:hypothetical protein